MKQIAKNVFASFDGDLNCSYSDNNAEKLVLRIRIINNDPLGDEEEQVNMMERTRSSASLKPFGCGDLS